MDLPPLSELAPRLLAMGGLLVCSAFFSGSEVALFSLSRGQRERLSRSEKAGERYVASLLAEPKRLIATLLLGNELVNITFSSLAAGLIGQVLAGWDTLAIVITSTAVTVPLLLVFGEITPKSIAIAVSEGWARVAARPLGLLMLLVTPARLIVTGIASVVVRLLGQDPNPKPKKLDEAQFRALIEAGSEAGEVGAAEQKLIHNVFAFGDRNVAEVMTPAKQVYSLSFELPLQRVVGEVAKSGYSRVPIHRGKRHEAHEIVGVLFSKDLVGWSSGRLAQKTLKDLLRPVTFVPRSAKLNQVFQEFRKNRTHFAVVVDEYGRQVGVVTMEDLLGELFGALPEEVRARAVPTPAGETAPRQLIDPPSAPMAAAQVAAAAPRLPAVEPASAPPAPSSALPSPGRDGGGDPE